MASYFDDLGIDEENIEEPTIDFGIIRRLEEEFHRSMMGYKPPASQRALREMEVILINEEHVHKKLTCPICTDEFKIDEQASQLECKHLFHKQCVITWFKQNNSCPLCRHELLTDDPEYELKKLDKQDPDRRKEHIESMYM